MSALKVLVPIHELGAGGVERVALRLARAWADDGANVRLVLGREDGSIQPNVLASVVLAPRWLPTRHWETLWMLLALPRLVVRERPDVFFCAGNTYAVIAVVMKLLLGNACPPVVAKISNDLERHDMPGLVRWFYHRWLRIQARHIDHFVGIAEPMRNEIVRLFGVTSARVSVIDDPAVDAALLARFASTPRKARAKGHQFLCVGRLATQKALPNAIEAFAQIATPDDRLVILGEGGERAALERLVRARGLMAQVSLPGHVDDLPQWFAASDVFILSSDYEGVPAAVIDALASGITIVATDCCVSMRPLLEDGKLGALVPVGDVAALAQAMDAARRGDAMVAARRERAAHFTIERAAPAWLAVFDAARQAAMKRSVPFRAAGAVRTEPSDGR